MITSAKEAIEYADNLIIDFGMLKDGSWQPDDDSCDCSTEAVELIKKYLEGLENE